MSTQTDQQIKDAEAELVVAELHLEWNNDVGSWQEMDDARGKLSNLYAQIEENE